MTATLTLEVTPRLEQRASPELLAYAGLLALPTLELESLVDREVEQNPALERLSSRPARCAASPVRRAGAPGGGAGKQAPTEPGSTRPTCTSPTS